MRFSGIFVVSSLIVSAFALPATTFAPTLKALTDLVKTSTTQVQNFDGSVAQFNAIDKGAQTLSQATIKANSALQVYGPFNENDSKEIIVVSEPLVSAVEVLCASLIKTKSAFFAEKYIIMKRDITQIATAAYPMMDGLVRRCDEKHRKMAEDLQTRSLTAFGQLFKGF